MNMICETGGQWMETGPVDSPSNNNWASFIHRWAPTTVNAYRVSVHLQQNCDNQVMIFNHKHMLQHFSSSQFSLFCHFSVFHLFINLYHPCLSFYMSPWRFAVVKAINPPGSLSPLGAFQDNAVTENFFVCATYLWERESEREGDHTIFHVTSRNK